MSPTASSGPAFPPVPPQNVAQAIGEILELMDLRHASAPLAHARGSRSFQEDFGNRIEALRDRLDVEVIGTVSSERGVYPMYRVRGGAPSGASGVEDVLVTGGVHVGHEPAGTLAVIEFLEKHLERFGDRFSFVVYPCVSPAGYEAGTRGNASGVDINRNFGGDDLQPEVRLLQDDLASLGRKFRFAIDLHEDKTDSEPDPATPRPEPGSPWPTEAYLYESQRDPELRLGRAIMDSLPEGAMFATGAKIYGDPNDRGVINYFAESTGNPAFLAGKTFDSFVFERYTDHAMTTETPTCWDLELRLRTQLHCLTRSLELIAPRAANEQGEPRSPAVSDGHAAEPLALMDKTLPASPDIDAASAAPRAIRRSFEADFGRRIEALRDTCDVEVLGVVNTASGSYPQYRITAGAVPGAPGVENIVLSGGVHVGHEPAGTLAILDFLENHLDRYRDRYAFIVYPCVSPTAYESGTRMNHVGVDLNRNFGTASPQPEVGMIQDDLAALGLRYRLTIDLHEDKTDAEPTGPIPEPEPDSPWPNQAYLYETQSDPALRIGRALMDSLPDGASYAEGRKIYGDTNDRGVINFSVETTGNPVYLDGSSLDSYLNGRYTGHSLTTETPTCWPLELRVRTQVHYITKALDALASA